MGVVVLCHRIALNPTPSQENIFKQAVGVARFSYNWALAEWKRQYEAGEKPNEAALRRQLNSLKREQFSWMLDVPKSVPQQSIKNCGAAFGRFFKKQNKYPTFKKKGRHDFARFDNGPETIKFKGKSIRMPVVGWVKMREELRFSGKRYQQQLKFVVKLNAHIANVRENWTHQTTTRIVREYSLMGIEDLNVRGMMANEKLARPISDVGFWIIRYGINFYPCN